MGNCFAKGDEGRRLHVIDLIHRAEKMANERKGAIRPGTAVQAEWEGAEWHDAVLCIDRGLVADVTWEDGSFTPDVPISKVRPISHLAKNQEVEALWKGSWLPATVITSLYHGTQYDIRWREDQSVTQNVPASFVRKRNEVKSVPRQKHSIFHKHHHRHDEPQGEKKRLHGILEICIQEARELPDADLTMFCGGKPGDPYCEMYDCRGRVVTKTPVIEDISDPVWKHHERAVRVADTDVLHFTVKDEDVSGNEIICECVLSNCNGLDIVASGKTFAGWLPLQTLRHKPGGELFVWMRLLPQHPPLSTYEVMGARFPAHPGHRVTLYQSAHIGNYNRILAPLPNNFIRENCWEDLARRICQAKHFIYVMGWSVNVKTCLLRERPLQIEGFGKLTTDLPLGELLKMQADKGIKVCVLIWREKTSVLTEEGMAGTSSGKTINYFRNTKVACRGVLRDGSRGLLSEWAVTHHQKGVIMDAPVDGAFGSKQQPQQQQQHYQDASHDYSDSEDYSHDAPPVAPRSVSGKRRVVAFIGGLDATKGRWDTPGKEIFSTLGTHHHGDFNQVMLDADEQEGPRQPWQDIHCQVEGPAAHDVVTNFENRWTTQTNVPGALFNANRSSVLLSQEENVYSGEGAFEAQVFRSIDRYSDNTVSGIEADCHQAWIQGIQNSERFLYIENQYFMGASDAWLQGNSSATSSNRIPNVIVERIVRAIREKKRFAAYIVIPLFPEGDPASAVMQEILFWQRNTIAAMYAEIAKALTAQHSHDHPTHYLNFYTLGQRKPGEAKPKEAISRGDKSRRGLVLKHCRIPIYVHSKMLIADDDYIVIGSCNINDRSMAGDRDTEIAIGLRQASKGAKGDIHAFRLSLWTEHLDMRDRLDPVCMTPESTDCLKFINNKTTQSWTAHADDYPTPQLCHMMKYPYVIGTHGELTAMQKFIPDAPGAKVLGSASRFIPDFLTS